MTEDVLHNRSTIALLEKLGLSRNEVKCYLASLTLGSAPVALIAKTAHVNRVNAYGAIKLLTDRGLLEQEITPKGRRIHPTPFERLQELAGQHQKQATKLRWKIEDFIAGTLARGSTGPEVPKLLFFPESKETWRTLYDRSLSATPGSEILFIGAYPAYVAGQYDDKWYIPERVSRHIKARCLNHRSPATERLWRRDQKELRESRFLPSEILFPCTIIIYNNEVSIFWETEAKQTSGVVMQGSATAGVMRSLFEMAWQMAGKAKPKIKNKNDAKRHPKRLP